MITSDGNSNMENIAQYTSINLISKAHNGHDTGKKYKQWRKNFFQWELILLQIASDFILKNINIMLWLAYFDMWSLGNQQEDGGENISRWDVVLGEDAWGFMGEEMGQMMQYCNFSNKQLVSIWFNIVGGTSWGGVLNRELHLSIMA